MYIYILPLSLFLNIYIFIYSLSLSLSLSLRGGTCSRSVKFEMRELVMPALTAIARTVRARRRSGSVYTCEMPARGSLAC